MEIKTEKPKITAVISEMFGECLVIEFKDYHLYMPREEIERELNKFYYPKKKYNNNFNIYKEEWKALLFFV